MLYATGYTLDFESLSRRYQLNLAAIQIWADHPLFGIGLNQFTASLPHYTQIEASTRFLQPVHNIYLLILSETGLIGLVILTAIFWKLFSIQRLAFSIPVIILLIIGLVDHYPLTLQTGQLLAVLSIGLFLSSPKLPAA